MKTRGAHRVFGWHWFRKIVEPVEIGTNHDPTDWWHCRRKIRHLDAGSARAEASRLNRDEPLPDRRASYYPCSRCDGWHVGGLDVPTDFAPSRDWAALVDVLGDRAVGCLVAENWGLERNRVRSIRQRAVAAAARAAKKLV